jgi:hypothetical protein
MRSVPVIIIIIIISKKKFTADGLIFRVFFKYIKNRLYSSYLKIGLVEMPGFFLDTNKYESTMYS